MTKLMTNLIGQLIFSQTYKISYRVHNYSEEVFVKVREEVNNVLFYSSRLIQIP